MVDATEVGVGLQAIADRVKVEWNGAREVEAKLRAEVAALQAQLLEVDRDRAALRREVTRARRFLRLGGGA